MEQLHSTMPLIRFAWKRTAPQRQEPLAILIREVFFRLWRKEFAKMRQTMMRIKCLRIEYLFVRRGSL